MRNPKVQWICLFSTMFLLFFTAAGTAENGEQNPFEQALEALNRQDYEEVAAYFRTAADQGDPDGLECLGYLYLTGLGVEQSREKAVELYHLAAEQGSEEAQKQLIMLGE